ncbi:MAG: acetylxylan esterase [Verrucomicrobia bacterium]|nr:acetylxylan esterase [Verrucomicrobiota bacterium]
MKTPMLSSIQRLGNTVRSIAATLTLGAALIPSIWAAPRVLPEATLPNDRRLQAPKDLDGYFPFTPPASVSEWNERAEQLRVQILVSQGLWPMPTRTALNPVIHGRIEQSDYTVEKVFFESMPGFFVTGNLYRPKNRPGRLPGILCPHGHWSDGRFTDNRNIKQEIVTGAERFEDSGRSVLQARCVQLARMGCVVFHYDMLGYADSQQISMGIAHSFGKQRPEMNSQKDWGLYSPQAESHCQSVMGLQTWNSIRSLDFLISLDDVDPARIAATGASGGGTQTFMLGAVDPRLAVAFPAVMVSTAMQGGCTCENASGLRVDTGNIEFAALFAPKPLGMTGADDWTREMMTRGFPELKRHWTLLGKPDLVMHKSLNHFGHNYNYPSRAVMYSWLNKHLKLGLEEPVVEQDYPRLKPEQLTVWSKEHPKPEGGVEFEKKLLRWWHEDAREQLQAAQTSPERFHSLAGKGLQAVIGRSLPAPGAVKVTQPKEEVDDNFLVFTGMLSEESRNEEIPHVFFFPKGSKGWKGRLVIWLHPDGKSGICDPSNTSAFRPNAQTKRLLDAGIAVATADLLYQGEFLSDGRKLESTPKVKNPREAAAYTFGYNASVCAQRIRDVLKLISFTKHHPMSPKTIELVGLDGAGHWAAAARAVSGAVVTRAAIDTQGFRFGHVSRIHDPNFLPGGARFNDVPGMLMLGAPGPLWLSGESPSDIAALQAAYVKEGLPEQLTVASAASAEAAVDWLLAAANP